MVDQISKRFGQRSKFNLSRKPVKEVAAVDAVSFEVKRGEIYGILGANGSGKSTLIRLFATLLLPDSGSVKVFDLDVVDDAAEVKRLINRVSVEASLFKKLSAMENLIYAARLYSVNIAEARKDIEKLLPALGILKSASTSLLKKCHGACSRRSLSLGLCSRHRSCSYLTSPTTGLDPRSKKDVQQFILNLRETHDATVLLTSHDMGEADALCDRLAILDKGKLVVEGTTNELKEAHRHTQGTPALPTLEDVFMEVTGRNLSDDDFEEDETGPD